MSIKNIILLLLLLITNKAQYTCHDMAKGEFDMLYLCAGGGGL